MSVWGHHQYTWPILLAQQPKLTLSLVTGNYLPGRKLAFNIASYLSLHLYLNHAVVVSQHIGAGVQLPGSCYLTKSSSSPFWGLAWALEVLSWSTPVFVAATKPVQQSRCSGWCTLSGSYRQSIGKCKNIWFCLRDPREISRVPNSIVFYLPVHLLGCL